MIKHFFKLRWNVDTRVQTQTLSPLEGPVTISVCRHSTLLFLYWALRAHVRCDRPINTLFTLHYIGNYPGSSHWYPLIFWGCNPGDRSHVNTWRSAETSRQGADGGVRRFYRVFLTSSGTLVNTKPMNTRDCLKVEVNTKPMNTKDCLKVEVNTKPMDTRDSLKVEVNIKPMHTRDGLKVEVSTKLHGHQW